MHVQTMTTRPLFGEEGHENTDIHVSLLLHYTHIVQNLRRILSEYDLIVHSSSQRACVNIRMETNTLSTFDNGCI